MSTQLIQQYYSNVEKLIRYGGTHNEKSVRKAFLDLLDHYARSKNLVVVPEVGVMGRKGHTVIPDGTLKDALRQDWGFWESKDEKDTLQDEIKAKFRKGYPDFNILFEDTQTAVLYQGGNEVLRANFKDAIALDAILTRFVSYEPKEVAEFHKAIELFSAEVDGLAATLRDIIENQVQTNPAFKTALNEFLELSRKTINPKVEIADVREMIIQHVLTEDIFMRVFDEAEFHRENAIARKLQEVAGAFYTGETKRNIHAKIAPYYETINAKASQISDNHEKQKFLKALYGSFYRAYNPKAADRLGIVYTPDEIVRFMIESADYLADKHFNRTLGDTGVEILDPATGTGTFITELIEYLPSAQLDYKYTNEIHCNEVSILPYYIANLNIEYTYKQKTGAFKEFEHICFVDTLDNTGFEHTGKQLNFFGFADENVARIVEQNSRKISVVIGNPPYNANQKTENENNKNREYPDIDKRIKGTYIRNSTAQKTKLYDMYARFIRWASDRLDKDGIVAFVSNNSFLNARSYDGFRKVVAEEFNDIYIIDLKGDARTSGERRRQEGGNVFSDQIRVGIAVYFFVRKKGAKGCHIHYNAIADYTTAEEKQAYLRDNRFTDLRFQAIRPDKYHNWLNLVDSDWDDLIPMFEDGKKRAIFDFSCPGISTNRDEWVYDISPSTLSKKLHFFLEIYNRQIEELKKANNRDIADSLNYAIKWSDALKRRLLQRNRFKYDNQLVISLAYRPFVKMFYYSEKGLSDRLTSNHFEMYGRELKQDNQVIAVNLSARPFHVLISDVPIDLHFTGDTRCLPLYRYAEDGGRTDNITDWAVAQFQKHFKDRAMSKQEIFCYVYGVLHHPTYRSQYETNLKRELPRIPFYDDFWKWALWGKRLMELHLNYESAEPYSLERDETRQDKPIVRLIARKENGLIELDTATSLQGIPAEAWEYSLGTYSALEWVLERYKEKKPKDPTVAEKFDTYIFADYKEQVIDLLRRVCTVSVETMRIIKEMPA